MDDSVKKMFNIGDRIEANFEGRGQWYSGEIIWFDENQHFFDIRYDNDDTERGVPSKDIRAQSNEDSSILLDHLPVPGQWVSVAHILLQHTAVAPDMLYTRPSNAPTLCTYETAMHRLMDLKNTLSKLQPLRHRLLTFKSKAETLSECINSSKMGGVLGEICIKSALEIGATTQTSFDKANTIKNKQIPSPIDFALTTLRIGQLSFPIPSKRGLHLIIRLPAIQRYNRGEFIENLCTSSDIHQDQEHWKAGVITRYDPDSGCYDILNNDGTIRNGVVG